MNPFVKIIDGAIRNLNSKINSIDLKTQDTIRRAFFLLIFIMSIIAIIVGYNMGKDAAKIKSPPVAQYVNDTFQIDISKEKKEADFSSLLESKIISESTVNNFKKYDFPMKEERNMNVRENKILEPQRVQEKSDIIHREQTPVEPETKPKVEQPKVRPLRRTTPRESKIIIKSEPKSELKQQVRPLDKKSSPAPRIYRNQEIIK